MTSSSSERPAMTDQTTEYNEATAYRVLARKYRPASFADLIGQEAMVRTLTNAIAGGCLAHAFILTGVRGVGKTTTARIIARALNCIGPHGVGGPTAAPCGVCEHCQAIAQDRHVDVVEMDAASRTGIDDIRELIEGVRYRPMSARTKVYIIDEVHMLSRQAFNGLLKTLEEPPEHVVFIFATTEIRKVPVTVLSRCQRFDLRRVAQAELAQHFGGIARTEQVEVDQTALDMIARAADGSVRDGLSLLDQAIAMSGARAGDAPLRVAEALVKEMLGLSDRARVFDLFEAVIGGQTPEALAILADMYASGADPAVVLQDLLELTHFLTRAKLVPESTEAPGMPETEGVRGRALSDTLSLPVLARCWQMLLKGLGETRDAPSPLQAAEMVLIRLTYASELPTPGELVKRLAAPQGGAGVTPDGPAAPVSRPGPQAAAATQAQPDSEAAPISAPESRPQPTSFAEVVALAAARREALLANHLAGDVHLVHFEPGRIELRPEAGAPRDLAGRLGGLLQEWTGERWVVSVSDVPGAPTLRSQQQEYEASRRAAAQQDPLVRAVLETFPGAKMVARRDQPTSGAERPEATPQSTAASGDGRNREEGET
jgi:DNA polymerase-3 subunit gamma/tau